MNYTYVASSNTATNGIALGAASQDVIVYKLIIGLPVSGGNITLYNSAVAVGGASTNIALKLTLPTFSTTNINPGSYVVDFGAKGLQLDGGNLQIDQTMQVTAVWEPAAQS